ncbi:Clp protease N-terminal domain-containing protein [Nocardiopsis aegyptia]|uniref:ATP-dependent Clp protease ATP-binding subunit ClpC n=1 Tax=Nocardiopsis aegyptia TaxID=220378 RepID=A0A7Z0JAX9_9ACTN|nr:Clp protease N-terminal domain-containing protein [Nocardiopsis aegyptia]NYJ34879.1 ATP-dependent Clp protease ATP-binding subunit ClpC [Nocardiopsis aegyptia]
MFERFTDEARTALVHAQSEAVALKHRRIGGGHLLLGLAQGGHGLAASTLASLGLDYEAARTEVARLGGRKSRTFRNYRRFASETKQALEDSLYASLHREHNFIGTEHMLLGLLHKENVASQVLLNLEIHPAHVIQRVHRTLDDLSKHTRKHGQDQLPYSN